MRRVHSDDIHSELEHPLRLLVSGHNGSQVGHCLAIVLGVGDCGERVQPAVILSNRDDVSPFFRVCVNPHDDVYEQVEKVDKFQPNSEVFHEFAGSIHVEITR